jgi:hypothetical protein
MIALTATEAADLHLEPSVENPDDPSKQIYFMAGYHHIHCLVSHYYPNAPVSSRV